MKEIKAIVRAYDKIDRTTTRAALATVVRVDGSSYRREGARMLVTDDRMWTGGISGGCLEKDALIRSWTAIINSTSRLVTYDTTEDDPYEIGASLGCNGIIDVLFTPVDFDNKNNPVRILKSCLGKNRGMQVVVTIIKTTKNLPLKAGDSLLYEGIESLGIFDDNSIETKLEEKIKEQFFRNRSAVQHIEWADKQQLIVFIELLPPEIHVMLMGHQYDVYPLARLAKEIGWQVTLVAEPGNINKQYLDIADGFIPAQEFANYHADAYTAILLISHDFKTDKKNLEKALQTETPYIGILGPKTRTEKIFSELEEENRPVSEIDKTRIYAPAGLDIGALSPEEIALSLTAEIRTVFSARAGGFLKLRNSTIHERA